MLKLSKDIWIICAGFVAAMHIGKLPPVVHILQNELHISLIQAGLLLSLVQGAGMCFALLLGSYVERIGLKNCIVIGLLLLFSASLWGSFSHDIYSLLLLRIVEGFGFLLVTLSAPAYIRKLVPSEQIHKKMGVWSAYMGGGVGIAILISPYLIEYFYWQGVWIFFAILSVIIALIIYKQVPNVQEINQDLSHQHRVTESSENQTVNAKNIDVKQLIAITLKHPPAWILAIIFATYTGQWLGLIGFLPSIYQQNQISLQMAGVLTAIVAMSNAVGTVCCGHLIQKGIRPKYLIQIGFLILIFCAIGFYGFKQFLPFILQYVLVLSFSLFGGFVAAVVFSQALHFAVHPLAISTTIGLILQLSAISQLVLPPSVAFIVSQFGSWIWVGVLMAILSCCGIVSSQLLFKTKYKQVSLKQSSGIERELLGD